jgi:hypothetical protein
MPLSGYFIVRNLFSFDMKGTLLLFNCYAFLLSMTLVRLTKRDGRFIRNRHDAGKLTAPGQDTTLQYFCHEKVINLVFAILLICTCLNNQWGD